MAIRWKKKGFTQERHKELGQLLAQVDLELHKARQEAMTVCTTKRIDALTETIASLDALRSQLCLDALVRAGMPTVQAHNCYYPYGE
jgi:hypothetical protein